MQRKSLLMLLLILFSTRLYAQTEPYLDKKIHLISPSQVYTEALKVHAEIDLLSGFFGLSAHHHQPRNIQKINIKGNFKPKHVWQMAYLLLVKVNIFRVKHGLPRVEEVGIEPVLQVNPNMPYGMLKRLLTEIRIIKDFFGITPKIEEIKMVSDKKPSDVFNALISLSLEMDILNQEKINPSSIFAQVMRLYQDVTTVLHILNIDDTTIPPNKNKNSQPKDAYSAVENFIKNLKKLQLLADIERTSFLGLKKEHLTAESTFILVGIAIAEFQTLKAYLGLKNSVTPAADFYEAKTSADVEQLVTWITRRIDLIKNLEVSRAR